MLGTETGIYLKTNRGEKCEGILPNVALFNPQLGYHDRFWTLHSVKNPVGQEKDGSSENWKHGYEKHWGSLVQIGGDRCVIWWSSDV